MFLLTFFLIQGFIISPFHFDIKAPAGARRKVKIAVINDTRTEKLKLFLKRMDVIQTEDGAYRLVEIGKGAPSCANWLKFKDSVIEVSPKSAKEVEVVIEIPSGVRGGRYGAIAFESPPVPEEGKWGTRIPVYFEIAIQPETKPKINITDMKILDNLEKIPRFMAYQFKDAIAVLVVTKNEGDIHAVCRGSLILRDKKGKKIKEVPLGGEGRILSNATVEVISIIKRPPPGEYVFDAVIRYGGLSPAKARGIFTILPKKIEKKEVTTTKTILLSIKPEIIETPIGPGAFRIRTIMLENEDDKEIKVNAEIKELINDEEGNLISSDSFGYEYSAVKFIELEEKEFTLKPKEKKVLKIKFNIPKEENAGGRYACLVLSASKEEGGLPTTFELPILLNFVGKANEELKVEKIEARAGRPVLFYVYLENNGDIHLKPTGIIEVRKKIKTAYGVGTSMVGELKLKKLKTYLLPKRKIKMVSEGDMRLEKGTYMIKVFINYGKNKEITYESEVTL